MGSYRREASKFGAIAAFFMAGQAVSLFAAEGQIHLMRDPGWRAGILPQGIKSGQVSVAGVRFEILHRCCKLCLKDFLSLIVEILRHVGRRIYRKGKKREGDQRQRDHPEPNLFYWLQSFHHAFSSLTAHFL